MKNKVMKLLRKVAVMACALLLAVNVMPSAKSTTVNAEGNPYYGGWSNCTWSAWQLVYEATGVALPRLGNAGEWYANAMAYGYTVSTTPRANSVGVWSGHVVYVTDFDGQNIYLKEGGFLGGYNECWADGYSARYGEALIGYIYIPSDMNEISAPTYSEQIASTTTYAATSTTISSEPGVERAIAEDIQDQDIENLEEEIIRKYDPELVEKKKSEEEQALKDMQAEEEQLTVSSPTSTPSTSSSNTASLNTSILTPLIKKK